MVVDFGACWCYIRLTSPLVRDSLDLGKPQRLPNHGPPSTRTDLQLERAGRETVN